MNHMKSINKKISDKAFTLIELLIVIGIIGVLVTIVIIAINPLRLLQDSKDTKMRSDLQQLKASMQLYYNDCKAYPTTSEFNAFSTSAGTAWTGNGDAIGNCSPDTTTYMRRVPVQASGADFLYNTVNSSGTACTNTGGNNCVNYVAGADMFNPTPEDTASTNQCSTPTLAGEFEVCND